MTNKSFPMILFDILESQTYPDAIGWGENRQLWIDPQVFQKDALKALFPGVTKFTSFTRKLNRYGFKRVMENHGRLDRIFVYHHDTFRQGVTLDDVKVIRIIKKPLSSKSRNDEPRPDYRPAVRQSSSGIPLLSRHQSTTEDFDDLILQRLILRRYPTRCIDRLAHFTSMSAENILQQEQKFLSQALLPPYKGVANDQALDISVPCGGGNVAGTPGIVNQGTSMLLVGQELIRSPLFTPRNLLDATRSIPPAAASGLQIRWGVNEGQLTSSRTDVVAILWWMRLNGFKGRADI